ncbi:hypothetical protein ANOM_008975 [Aspergillus nomiae NRRL 13137]|uniref:Uncharacterized protein n=1 Tax=Aspergillus nomiae NRRL (strain ATCC 15546 / NRRL 13137 / CBS 260.88 / M93) TaxID=1509407 RepID=A0A0L1IQQ6_ASPN3|nr:uncharacterized protein ANOM_008975 [Aspergillus nomiae NRRL 13137]KNG81715.1 hypothetical protein ANOM_008975 [Aspergillus nomiae NRRL 13137]
MTALQYAIYLGQEDKARLLLKRCDPNAGDEEGQTAFHYAVRSSRASLGFIQLVVEAGADLHKEDHSSKTPLHNAAQGRGREVASFLVEQATNYANRYQELEKDVKKGTVAESPANTEIELDFRKMD